MPLIRVTELLKRATEQHYGVPAINTFNYETVKWAIAAAERENAPIIIQLYPGYVFHVPLDYIAYMAVDMAKKATVPIAVHLDHSPTFEVAVSGIRAGFPSIMIDGSTLSYEENAALTAAVVRTARVFDVDVEAELGHVGMGSREEDITNSDYYTDIEQAKDFVAQTGCDVLAIAVGNAHGPYVRTPKLDFERIQSIREAVDVPLVLHGCSDIPDEQMREAVRLGMSKFNIATEYFRAVGLEMKKAMMEGGKDDAASIFFNLGEPVMDFVSSKIRLLNPESRV